MVCFSQAQGAYAIMDSEWGSDVCSSDLFNIRFHVADGVLTVTAVEPET
jgi:hypothetical protein